MTDPSQLSKPETVLCDVMIGPMHGPNDPPPIALTFKQGSDVLLRIELSAADFGLALTGRLVRGSITRRTHP